MDDFFWGGVANHLPSLAQLAWLSPSELSRLRLWPCTVLEKLELYLGRVADRSENGGNMNLSGPYGMTKQWNEFIGVLKLFHPYKWSSWPLYPLTMGIVRIFQAAVSRDKSNSRHWHLGGGFKDISSSNHPFFRGKLAVSFRDSNLNGKLGGGFKDFWLPPLLGEMILTHVFRWVGSTTDYIATFGTCGCDQSGRWWSIL